MDYVYLRNQAYTFFKSSNSVVFFYALFNKRKDPASPPLGNKMKTRINLKR